MEQMTMAQKIDEWFQYHSPTPGQVDQYQAIREKAKELAHLIAVTTPPSADQMAALRKLRECVMTANAAITCKGV